MTKWVDVEHDPNAIKVLDHGFVVLIDIMGNDSAIANAARTSYGSGTKKTSDDRALIRHLIRNQHTSPIEMVELKFLLKMPIFIARQHVRHRTACLSGDTLLDFDLPGNAIEHKYRRMQMKVSDFHSKWHFGEFGNKNKEIDLSWIENEKLYIASEIGSWFLNRKDQLASVAIMKKAKNNKLIPHYYGKDVKLFYTSLVEKSNFKRNRLKTMNLRSLNEDTKELFYSNIVDIWKSGQKETYEISIRIDDKIINKIETSKDHLFFTEYGWKKLNDIKQGDKIWALTRSGNEISCEPIVESTEDEIWAPCFGYETQYSISSFGKVVRTMAGKACNTGRIKNNTIVNDRAVVGLSKNSKTTVHSIQRLILQSFLGDNPGLLACHKNGNSLDNRLSNLYWGTEQDNSNDAIRHDTTTRIKGRLLPILDITSTGIKETYDIQVEGEFHNFSANGFIVHNSINEYSARYSIMSDECYLPELDRFQEQNKTNKQASGDSLDYTIANDLRRTLDCSYVTAYDNYTYALDNGLSRELARIQLPVANYTEMYWKIDLKNFFNYIKLRMDKQHAQFEIVQYAEAMYTLVKQLLPLSCEAFEDYWFNAKSFSKQELDILGSLLRNEISLTETITSDLLSKNELNDFIAKLTEIYNGNATVR
jgi:thymidylate synthase ThyX